MLVAVLVHYIYVFPGIFTVLSVRVRGMRENLQILLDRNKKKQLLEIQQSRLYWPATIIKNHLIY